MLDVIFEATFIHFEPKYDNAVITKRMLIETYKFARSKDYTFKFDEAKASFYIWVNDRRLSKEEIQEVANRLIEIYGRTELKIQIEDIEKSNPMGLKPFIP